MENNNRVLDINSIFVGYAIGEVYHASGYIGLGIPRNLGNFGIIILQDSAR